LSAANHLIYSIHFDTFVEKPLNDVFMTEMGCHTHGIFWMASFVTLAKSLITGHTAVKAVFYFKFTS
jgi:hypothetical protein